MREMKALLVTTNRAGISFEPMALRLLRRDFQELDDDIVALLKNEMFENDGRWFFPEQIADEETRRDIRCQAEAWFNNKGFFSLSALFAQFEGRLAHCDSIDAFERFFNKIQLQSTTTVKAGTCRFLSVSGDGNRRLAECAASLVERIESEGGEIAEATLLEENPHLDKTAIAAVFTEHRSDTLARMEVEGYPVWKTVTVTAGSLPADFGAVVTDVANRLLELGFGATIKNLEMFLSVHYGVRFSKEYQLTKDLFCKVVAQCYQGKKQVKWANLGMRLVNCGSVPMNMNIENSNHRRRKPTRFHDLGIPVGAVLEYYNNQQITCTVADEINKVNYKGEIFSISALAVSIAKISACNGFLYFCYKGVTLWNRRLQMEGSASHV